VPPDRPVHSLHAYFIRPGDPDLPIVYTVDRIRDGRSFSTRRVVAVQHGRAIFALSASFNPVCGQGMSVAALEALTLRRHLRQGAEPQPRRFFRDLAGVVDVPWDIAAGGDLAFPGVQGRRTPKVRLVNAYLARLHAAAADDAGLASAFLRVAGLVAPPQSLLRPSIAVRVLRASRHPATVIVRRAGYWKKRISSRADLQRRRDAIVGNRRQTMVDAAFAVLISQRLVLRRFRAEDLDAFVAYRSDPKIARYQNWEAPYRPSQARQFLQELQAIHPDTPGEWFQFALALRGTDRLIGDCAAHVGADDPRQAEIGFTLASQHQGSGYATEAVRRLLHYLLVERGKHRVRATCDDRNTPSAAVLERVGMRREGHLLESTWSKGEWTNDLLYGVLHREWPTGF
jgi:RimJ/RimL family protein N-acetyltransferase